MWYIIASCNGTQVGLVLSNFMIALHDHLAKFPELDDYDISAYDGHFHRHACHASKDDKDRYRPVGGIYEMGLLV